MRNIILNSAAIAFAAVALAGCDHGGEGVADGRFCTPFPQGGPNGAPAAISDPAAAFDDCIHRWSYSLASARDGADVVAGAAVAACGTSLIKWNQESLGQAGPDAGAAQGPGPGSGGPAPSDQAISLTTGQTTDLIGEHAQYAQSRAMFYVVQARASRCAAPSGKPPAGEP